MPIFFSANENVVCPDDAQSPLACGCGPGFESKPGRPATDCKGKIRYLQ